MEKQSDEKIRLLKDNLQTTRQAKKILEASYKRSKAIIPLLLKKYKNENEIPIEQGETLEALASRFGRLSDLLLQKLFRSIDAIELIDEGTLLDRLNRMEKRTIIQNLEDWKHIRELRNNIVHEYVVQNIFKLYKDVYDACPELFQTLDRLEEYIAKKKYI